MNYLIKNATIVNEGKRFAGDVRVADGLIAEIGQNLELRSETLIDATGKLLLPGVIDDQVHFREPGLTHKGEIYTEAKAAVAGGVTSFMEQPNTVPSATTIDLLEQKFSRASEVSLANFSFFMGTTNSNIEEIRRMDIRRVAGLKIFLGSSTGDMLVDKEDTLETIFREVKTLIAVHAEDDPMIKGNMARYVQEYGDNLNAAMHPLIRSREACLASSSKAVDHKKKYGTRLHVFHISTADELALFDNTLPLSEKKITAEVCVHHLWFSDEDYKTKGNYIKWNPAVKSAHDREELWKALLDNRIDLIATDHAPHTIEEKEQPYAKAPSGGPLVQHSLIAMLEKSKQGVIPIERVVEKMSHAVADLFRIDKRGYIREGYHADLVLVDPNQSITVDKSNILYKCGWSPFEGVTFSHTVTHTWVNGHLVYCDGTFDESQRGMRLAFNR